MAEASSSGAENGRRQAQESKSQAAEAPAGGAIEKTKRGERKMAARGSYTPPLFGLSPLSLLTMNPFALMRRFSDEMDEIFSAVGGTGLERQGQGGGSTLPWVPQVEVLQRDNQLMIRVDLPGLEREDIRVRLLDDAVVIEGERRDENEERQGGVYRSERSYGMFRRVIPLPPEVQGERVTARFDKGVLEVAIPLDRQKAQGRQVEIAGGTSGTPAPGSPSASPPATPSGAAPSGSPKQENQPAGQK